MWTFICCWTHDKLLRFRIPANYNSSPKRVFSMFAKNWPVRGPNCKAANRSNPLPEIKKHLPRVLKIIFPNLHRFQTDPVAPDITFTDFTFSANKKKWPKLEVLCVVRWIAVSGLCLKRTSYKMFLWKGLWLLRMAPLNKPDTADGSFYNFIRQAHSEKYLDRWLYKAFICNCIPQASTNQRAPPAATEAFTLTSSVTSKPQA